MPVLLLRAPHTSRGTLGHFRHPLVSFPFPLKPVYWVDKYVMTALPVLLTLAAHQGALTLCSGCVWGWGDGGVEESHPYAAPPGCPGHGLGRGWSALQIPGSEENPDFLIMGLNGAISRTWAHQQVPQSHRCGQLGTESIPGLGSSGHQ